MGRHAKNPLRRLSGLLQGSLDIKNFSMVRFNKKSLLAGTAVVFIVALSPYTDLQAGETAAVNEIDQMRNERGQFVKEIRRVENLNKKYTKEIEDVRSLLVEKDADFQKRMKALEDKLAQQRDEKVKQAVAEEQNQQTSKEMEDETNATLSKSVDLDSPDPQFEEELAKAHYNTGNIYYERGEYQRAVVEYSQAVDLMPDDADAHYNLAFVSGEYLGDQETALKHYQWYLYLKPEAEDAALVKEKILTAKLHLRSKVDSILDKDNGQYNLVR